MTDDSGTSGGATEESEASKMPPNVLLGAVIVALIAAVFLIFVLTNQGFLSSIIDDINSLFPIVK